MNDDPNISHSPQSDDSQPSRSKVPVWIFALMLMLLYLGGVYFDHHSGWFNAKVYNPYSSAEEVDAYQPKSGEAAIIAQGKKTYDTVCAACHGADGEGKPGQAPPLAGAEWVNVSDVKPVVEIPQLGLNGPVTVKGQTMTFASGMPPMGAGLSDQTLAAVLSYVRSSWGNKAGPVTADDVKSIRAAVAGHPAIDGEQGLKSISEK